MCLESSGKFSHSIKGDDNVRHGIIMKMVSDLACLSHPLQSTEANCYHPLSGILVGVEASCTEVSGRIQDIHEVAVKMLFGFQLHLFVKPDQADFYNSRRINIL